MNKKLELTDIAGYLPYGLKVISSYLPTLHSYRVTGYNDNLTDSVTISTTALTSIDIRFCKPILHPMNDLVKPMSHPDINDGEEFVPIMELVKLLWDKKWVLETEETSEDFINIPYYYQFFDNKVYVRYYKGQLVSYDDRSILAFHGLTLPMIDLLNKLHFDYKGLIHKGLAVDINTIK